MTLIPKTFTEFFKSRPAVAVCAILVALTAASCGGRGNSDLDDVDDIDDIVIDDADDISNDSGSRRVRRYTRGLEMPDNILDPKYLSRKNLATHLKPQLEAKNVEFNINKRLDFSTRLFFPDLCLYRDVKLIKRIAFTYYYDTGITDRCRPEGRDITRFEQWEKGEIEVDAGQQPEEGQDLDDYWFQILEKIRNGERVGIEHRFKRTLIMDYTEKGFELRKSQLTTQSTLDGDTCEFDFNESSRTGQEFNRCVRQTGVRIWNRENGKNGISDFVRFYNPDRLYSDDTFEFQEWFNAGSGFNVQVNTWSGKLIFNEMENSKTTRPRAILEDPKGRSIEFEPKPSRTQPGATIEVLRESMQR